jgi:hypothetical protein
MKGRCVIITFKVILIGLIISFTRQYFSFVFTRNVLAYFIIAYHYHYFLLNVALFSVCCFLLAGK